MRIVAIFCSVFFLLLCSSCSKQKDVSQKKLSNETSLPKTDSSTGRDSIGISMVDSGYHDTGKEAADLANASFIEYKLENPEFEVDSLLDSAEDQDLRAGFGCLHGGCSNGQTKFYLPNRKGFKYHVISPYGEDLYIPAEIEKSEEGGCAGLMVPIWRVKFAYNDNAMAPKLKSDRDWYNGLIVVGVKDTLQIKPPIRREIPDSLKAICLTAVEPEEDHRIVYVSSGRNNGIERIFVEVNYGTGAGFIAIVDFDGKNGEVKFKTKEQWSAGRNLDGQADLNGDGLSDVFLVNYGDYGGFNIFAERRGKWIRIHNHGPQPC
jgi:hypothetical protein